MSAYYHASDAAAPGPFGAGIMRNEFVGLLVAVGVNLILYQGFTKFEDVALNIAGVLAICVALIPMPWPPGASHGWSMHGSCAVAFFVCIAYVCFRARDTIPMLPKADARQWFSVRYCILGWLMLIAPAIAVVMCSVLGLNGASTFFVEAGGIYVFAVYWLLKSHEIKLINADPKVARRFRVRPHSWRMALSRAAFAEPLPAAEQAALGG